VVFVRVCCSCLVGALALALAPAPAGAAEPPATTWVRPVAGAVARPFAPPAHRFGPGHLGVDFASRPGAPVHAAGAGTVTIAGSVAGARHVVVAHAGGLRTSYSFLASVHVHKGDRVRAGDVVGTSGGTGENHSANVFHFGLRVGREYVDPMLLFGAVELTKVVHLAPTSKPFGFSAGEERQGLIDGLRSRLATAARGLSSTARTAASVGLKAEQLVALDPLARVATDNTAVALGRGMLGYIAERRSCDPSAPAADGTGGSGHRALVVAGIDSHTDANGRTIALPTADLGYHDDEVSYFSYRAEGGNYEKADTYSPIMVSARRLADQLRALQRKDPGREVDLLAHSQGGVVTLAFLNLVYDPGDPTYPPLGTVVTLSSPLQGAPLAETLGDVERAPGGSRLVHDTNRVAPGSHPDLESAALRDLDPDSDLMRRLDAAPMPDDVQITTIGSTYDPVVPANHSSSDDAAQRTVIETVVTAGHTRVVDDPDALRATRSALERGALPCRSFSQYVRAELVPHAISTLETGGRR
jgi:hypothetical protein